MKTNVHVHVSTHDHEWHYACAITRAQMYYLGKTLVSLDEDAAIKWLRKAGYELNFPDSDQAKDLLYELHTNREAQHGFPEGMHPDEEADWHSQNLQQSDGLRHASPTKLQRELRRD